MTFILKDETRVLLTLLFSCSSGSSHHVLTPGPSSCSSLAAILGVAAVLGLVVLQLCGGRRLSRFCRRNELNQLTDV